MLDFTAVDVDSLMFISGRSHPLLSAVGSPLYSDQNSVKQIIMTTTKQLRVLFFDVFGTCVAQRTPVADELWRAAQEALKSDMSSIRGEIRDKATKMVCLSQLIIINQKLISFIVIRAMVRIWRG